MNIFQKVNNHLQENPNIILTVFPNSKKKGHEIYFDEPSYNSWSYNIPKRVVKDFRASERQDLIEVYRKLNNLSSSIEAAKKIASMLSIKTENEVYDSRNLITSIWHETHPIKDTVAEAYLKSRYIELPTLLSYDMISALRFHPNLYNNITKEKHPAMVAGLFPKDSAKPVSIQRTYLKHDGTKLFDKGSLYEKSNKMSLGSFRGLHVSLGTNINDKCLVICEGVESGLSLLQDLRMPVWCSLTAGNMINITPPPLDDISYIDLRPDIDPNKVGIDAANTAARRWAGLGYEVDINLPTII